MMYEQQEQVMNNGTVCEVQNLSMAFGGLQALSEVDLRLPIGKLISLIGPNGAGKTTLFNCITGFIKPTKGRIIFDGKNIERLHTYRISRLGIKRTFQNVQIFPSLSVLENVLIGYDRALKSNILTDMLKLPWIMKEEKAARERAIDTMTLLGIAEFQNVPAGSLPYGIQKKVELTRALVSRPRLLLADEPVCGLSLAEQEDLGERFKRIRDELGISILLIEHNMEFVMPLSDEVHVLNFGKLIASGSPIEITGNEEVREAYLGKV